MKGGWKVFAYENFPLQTESHESPIKRIVAEVGCSYIPSTPSSQSGEVDDDDDDDSDCDCCEASDRATV